MPSHIEQVKTILVEALAKPSGPERQAYLDNVCTGKPRLRSEVSRLIDAYENAGDFLERRVPFARPHGHRTRNHPRQGKGSLSAGMGH